ncbi:hypothetical protein GCM10027586_20220 [Kineococcus gypseus]
MPRALTSSQRPKNRHRLPDPLPQAGAHRGAACDRAPHPSEAWPQTWTEAWSTADDEVAALRGSDGLTAVERDALAHRYDVTLRIAL